MRFTRLKLENWRNFRRVDVPLSPGVVIVGPTASGKTNLLDGLLFLRDVADPACGFQRAVLSNRGGMAQLRHFGAQKKAPVAIEVEMIEEEIDEEDRPTITYRLEFAADDVGRPVVRREVVKVGDLALMARPDEADRGDAVRLRQPHLQQESANRVCRGIRDFLASIRVHDTRGGMALGALPRRQCAAELAERIASTEPRTRAARLRDLHDALRAVISGFERLDFRFDDRGVPRLGIKFSSWRSGADTQDQSAFSEGTLALLGRLWTLLEPGGPLVLDGPDLPLDQVVGLRLARWIPEVARSAQVLMVAEASFLAAAPDSSPADVLMLIPELSETRAVRPVDDEESKALLASGTSLAQAVLTRIIRRPDPGGPRKKGPARKL